MSTDTEDLAAATAREFARQQERIATGLEEMAARVRGIQAYAPPATEPRLGAAVRIMKAVTAGMAYLPLDQVLTAAVQADLAAVEAEQ